MAMKDDNGNTIDPKPIMERFIYIECRFNDKPKVDLVLYNRVLLMSFVTNKEETTAVIGTRKGNVKSVNLIPKKGNIFGKLICGK